MKNKVVYNQSYGGFSLSKEACRMLNARKGREVAIEEFGFLNDDIERHDPDLIAVVEAIGCKAASGYFSDLAITEVDEPYRICEYDGFEWVETPSTIKWITVR